MRSYLETQGHYRQQGLSCNHSIEIGQLNVASETLELFPYTPEEAQRVLTAQEQELGRLVALKKNQERSFRMARGKAKAYYASVVRLMDLGLI